MQRAAQHQAAADWQSLRAADSVTLDFDHRHRRRLRLVTDKGEPVLLDLPKAVAMAEGDGLQLDDGRWIAVRAAAESVLEITCPDPAQLARIAWHLGNRHLPSEIGPDTIRIRPDHVIGEMVRGLGATVVERTAPFQPEGGAYAGHSHD